MPSEPGRPYFRLLRKKFTTTCSSGLRLFLISTLQHALEQQQQHEQQPRFAALTSVTPFSTGAATGEGETFVPVAAGLEEAGLASRTSSWGLLSLTGVICTSDDIILGCSCSLGIARWVGAFSQTIADKDQFCSNDSYYTCTALRGASRYSRLEILISR